MKIVTCIKQVANRDSAFEPRSDSRWVNEENLDFEVNEPDAYALEAGLQLKEKEGGELIALCIGGERTSKAIREALAKGADRAIHIDLDAAEALDTLASARLLAAAIRDEDPDLILTGLQSDDVGAGQTGVVLAELLGLPHATIIMEIEKTVEGLRVRRELEGGLFQHVDLPLPAVLTIQSGIHRLRYATLMGIKKARAKEVRRLEAAMLEPGLNVATSIERIYFPERSKQGQMLEGSPAEAARALVEKLRHEARAL